MSAADFQRHIDAEGAREFVHRLIKDIDPHSPEEPNYDIVLEHVAEGSNGWLHAAAQIAPFTDATFSQGLRVAIADALVVESDRRPEDDRYRRALRRGVRLSICAPDGDVYAAA